MLKLKLSWLGALGAVRIRCVCLTDRPIKCSREEMRDVLQAYRCRILVSGRVWSIVMVDVVVQHRS